MTKTLLEKNINQSSFSYSFNKTLTPIPKSPDSKLKPPGPESECENTTELFKPKTEASIEEKIVQFMSEYKKAERATIVNFYTGGGPYKIGMMDAIYSGIMQSRRKTA